MLLGRREGSFCRKGNDGKVKGDRRTSLLVMFLDVYVQGSLIVCVSIFGDSMFRFIFSSSSRVCGSNGFMSRVSHKRSCMFFGFGPFVLDSVDIVFELSVSSEMVPA